MSNATEREGWAQYYPGDGDDFYLLYDGPDEWGLRIKNDLSSAELGATVRVDGAYPNYALTLPSGMNAKMRADTTAHSALGEVRLVADFVREALRCGAEFPRTTMNIDAPCRRERGHEGYHEGSSPTVRSARWKAGDSGVEIASVVTA